MAEGTLRSFIALIGDPVVAVMLGLLVSIYTLAKNIERKEVTKTFR